MKHSSQKRRLLLLFCAVLLLSLLTLTAAADDPEANYLYFSASRQDGIVAAPEKLYYEDASMTILEVLQASGHTFSGLENDMVYAIDGVSGNYNRSDETGGFKLDRSASSIRYFCFYEGEDFLTAARLSLIRTMAEYRQEPQDVQNAAAEAYQDACTNFSASDDSTVAELDQALQTAIETYENEQNGQTVAVRFTDGAKDYSLQNYPGVTITAQNPYGKVLTDENGDGTLALVPGSYTFSVVQDYNRIDGSIEVRQAQTVTAQLPSGSWMTEGARVSLSSGDAFEAGELTVTQDGHTLRVCVPDTYATGSVYLYADYDHEVFTSTPVLQAYYTQRDGTVINPETAPELSARVWRSMSAPVTAVLKAGPEGNTVVYRVGAEDENGFLRTQEYTLVLERSLSLSALHVYQDGRAQASDPAFAAQTREYTYQIVSGAQPQTVTIDAAPFGDYELYINGEAVTGSAELSITEEETDVQLELRYPNAVTSGYTLHLVQSDGKNCIFTVESGVTIAVYNKNGEPVAPTSVQEDRYAFKLIPEQSYSYIATRDGCYHTAGTFVKSTAVDRLTVSVETNDWLSSVQLFETRSASTLYAFEEGAFASGTHSYTLRVSDRSSSMFAAAALIDDASLEALDLKKTDLTITAIYDQISISRVYNGVQNTVELSQSAKALPNLLQSNALENTLTVRVSRTEGSKTYYQDYTVQVQRVYSLGSLTASYAGTSLLLEPAYTKDVTDYSVTVPMAARAITLWPVLRSGVSLPYGAESDGYLLEAEPDKLQKNEDGSYTVSLDGTANPEEVWVDIKNTNSPEEKTRIRLTVKKTPPVTFTPALTPEDALLVVIDHGTKTRIWPDATGAWSLSKGFTYDYYLTALGYVGKSGTFCAADTEEGKTVLTFSDGTSADVQQDAQGNLHVSLALTLTAAEENTSLDHTIEAEWADFRGTSYTYDEETNELVAGGTNYSNNGVVSSQLPISTADSMLYWASQLGEGYGSKAVGCPILVDGDLITYSGNQLFRVDAVSGEVLATGTMVDGSSFSINPPTYYDGMLFIGLSNGRIQAFDAKTLQSLWVYVDEIGGQPNCPITVYDGYLYTGFWQGEVDNGNFVCLSVTDEDPASTTERKIPTWTITQRGGFYWAGAYVCDDFLLVGTDDGQSGYAGNDTARLLMLDPKTGELLDSREGISGDQRSTICYDAETSAYYFTTKGGYFYQARVTVENGVRKISELRSLKLDNYASDAENPPMSTCTPVVYNHRAYIGVSGTGQFKAYSGHNLTVIDLDRWKIAYKVRTQGYAQTSGLLTTAYESTGYVYVYFFDNYTPGKLRILRDRPGQTAPEFTTKETDASEGKNVTYDTPYALFTPTGDEAQYVICSPLADAYGMIYFKNDSARLMAFGPAVKSVNIVQLPDKTNYRAGETFDPTGMKVTVTYTNGKERDITKYVTYSTDPLTAEDAEFAITFPFAKYRNVDNTDGTSSAGISVKQPYAALKLTISGQAYQLGDINGDGKVSAKDAALLYAYINGRTTLTAEQLTRADVSGDGKITAKDAALIYAFVNGRITKFPAEKEN